MVERNIYIDVVGIQEGQKVEVHEAGKYSKLSDSEYLEYTDEDGVKNHLKILSDSVYLTKYTNPPTNMIFKEREKYNFKYQTSYGAIELSIMTNQLKIERRGYDFDISIKYDMVSNGEAMKREISITTREKN